MNTPAHLGDDILNAWIDGVATEHERIVVEDHVASCDICQKQLEELRAIKSMFSSLPDVTPPRSFTLTADQAKKPTPIRSGGEQSTIVRLLPIVRTLSVAAVLAVMVLGGVLALGPSDDTIDPANETGRTSQSFQEAPPMQAMPSRGEVIDQGEAASAHDSTSDALESDAQESVTSSSSSDDGLTSLEIATITVGVLALGLGVSWIWMSMSLQRGMRK